MIDRQLEVSECITLLQTTSRGRIGVVVDGALQISPVSYEVDPHTGTIVVLDLLVGVDETLKLPTKVALEVDRVAFDGRCAWSVLVVGHIQDAPLTERHVHASDGDELDVAGAWRVSLVPDRISGQRSTPCPGRSRRRHLAGYRQHHS